jgi:hypothetical protein
MYPAIYNLVSCEICVVIGFIHANTWVRRKFTVNYARSVYDQNAISEQTKRQ